MTEPSPVQNESQSSIRSVADASESMRQNLHALYVRYQDHLISTPIEVAGFWSAVVMPFLYVPLLSGGLEGTEGTVFVTLVAVNLFALLAGHTYKRD